MPLCLTATDAALRICVDCTAGQISGRVFSRRLTRPVEFNDLGSLLLQIDAVLELQKYPAAFQHARSFRQNTSQPPPAACEAGDGLSAAAVAAAHGTVSTFRIRVLSRRSSTWQGEIDWLDGTPPECFSSDLVLVKQIETRLSASKKSLGLF